MSAQVTSISARSSARKSASSHEAEPDLSSQEISSSQGKFIGKLSSDEEKKLLDLLEVLLTGDYQQYNIKQTPENYFFIEDILTLPQFEPYSLNHIVEAIHSDGKLRFSIRGSKMRLKPPELNQDADVILSKKLAWILRHAAEKEGFVYESGGWLDIDRILALPEFSGYQFSDLERVVNQNDKKRFEIRTHPVDGRLQMRATQGHTTQVDGLELRLITDPREFPVVVHGTYFKNWSSIRSSGLKRMGRNHVHFACGESPDDGVISGMRSSAEVLIYLDIAKAMRDGLEFYVSSNKVILCAGDSTGTIPSRYFKEVYQRRPRGNQQPMRILLMNPRRTFLAWPADTRHPSDTSL